MQFQNMSMSLFLLRQTAFTTVLLFFSTGIIAQQNHYKTVKNKTHYRSPGVRTYDQNNNKFHKIVVPPHSKTPVRTATSTSTSSPVQKTSTTKPVTGNQASASGTTTTVAVKSNPSYETSSKMISADSLKRLKAILIVADVDGANGSLTKSFIAESKEVESYLRSLGFQVLTFYCPNDSWEEITVKGKGAHLLHYMGHGTHAGEEGLAGGFALTNGIIPSFTIKTELQLHKSAVILFNHVCLSAGSSAGDTESDIGVKTASGRVSTYAYPFVDMGAGLYYSNNYNGSTRTMIEKIFSNQQIFQIYKYQVERVNNKVVLDGDYSFNKDYKINISVNNVHTKSTFYTWNSTTNEKKATEVFIENEYEIALVARKDFKVGDLFK
jgi:hypothetical protein